MFRRTTNVVQMQESPLHTAVVFHSAFALPPITLKMALLDALEPNRDQTRGGSYIIPTVAKVDIEYVIKIPFVPTINISLSWADFLRETHTVKHVKFLCDAKLFHIETHPVLISDWQSVREYHLSANEFLRDVLSDLHPNMLQWAKPEHDMRSFYERASWSFGSKSIQATDLQEGLIHFQGCYVSVEEAANALKNCKYDAKKLKEHEALWQPHGVVTEVAQT